MNVNSTENVPNYLKTTTLSKRETEVVIELMKGHPAKRIASNIFLSVNTVQTHLQRIRCKLKAENNLQVAIKYLQLLDNPVLCLKKIAPAIAFGFLAIQISVNALNQDLNLQKRVRTHRNFRVRR